MSAGSGGMLKLGDLTPEYRPIEVERDGKSVVLEAFYYGGSRCPGSVKSELAAARDALLKIVNEVEAEQKARAELEGAAEGAEPGLATANQDDARLEAAFSNYARTTLKALCPGLTYGECDTLAGDTARVNEILIYLGYRQPSPVPDSAEGTDENPPPDTTAKKSPRSITAGSSRT